MYNCESDDCRSCNTFHKSLFSALTTEELDELSESKMCYKVAKGETLFQMGTHPRGLFCVQQGKMKVVRVSGNGKEQIVHLVKNGDVMGYRALLSNEKYSCSCIALEDSKLCFIPRTLFLNLIERSHRLTLKVLQMFSVEMRVAEKNLTDLGILPVRQRIAQSLLQLIENYGYRSDNCTIDIALSREELASLTGTTRETAIRALSALAEEQLIELKAKNIRILDFKKLLMAAEIQD